MSAAPAYDYTDRAYEYDRSAQPDISVVPGRGRRAETQALPDSAVAIAKAAAVLLVLLALVGAIRVTLSSAATATAMDSQEITNQIEVARSEGNALEVQQSMLSNPTRIKEQAAALGMVAAGDTVMLDLTGDVVVTDAAGNLSLTGSLAAATQE